MMKTIDSLTDSLPLAGSGDDFGRSVTPCLLRAPAG
jgi:hypothetical protein